MTLFRLLLQFFFSWIFFDLLIYALFEQNVSSFKLICEAKPRIPSYSVKYMQVVGKRSLTVKPCSTFIPA
jgi:hypothetical protein